MNNFEALCRLASDEKWCWNLYCTTCGHIHFRYAFSELAAGKSPDSDNWVIHNNNTRYSQLLGPLPKSYRVEQKENILDICNDADIFSIAKSCIFPDWLGYLGLILTHMRSNTGSYRKLSSVWAGQLVNLVQPYSTIHTRLTDIAGNSDFLTLSDLEACEAYINHSTLMNR